MPKKYLIIASKKDKAGINITTQLSQFKKPQIGFEIDKPIEPFFDLYLVEEDIILDANYDQEKINKYDFIIFASQHKSEKKEKTLSIHAPGNPKEAHFGGQTNKLCPTSALFQKHTFEILHKKAKEHDLKNYKVTLECTHHGPLINRPCIFIEIGSTETEWNDRRAAFVVATTINETIESFTPNKYREIAVGIGGPHYCPNFNKLQLESNVAISHILPQYTIPLTEEIIKEAIEKTEEEIDFVILDWKGIKDAEERKNIIKILEKNYIPYKKISSIKR